MYFAADHGMLLHNASFDDSDGTPTRDYLSVDLEREPSGTSLDPGAGL